MRSCSLTKKWISGHGCLTRLWIDGRMKEEMNGWVLSFTHAKQQTSLHKSLTSYKWILSPGKIMFQRWHFAMMCTQKDEIKAMHFLCEQIMKEQNNHITCSMHILWWWDKSYYRKVKESQPEENITRSAFSLGILQSRSQRYVNQKVAQKRFRWGAN